MRTCATFRTTIDHAHEPIPGLSLAERIMTHVREAGLTVTLRGVTEYAQTFVVAVGRRTFLVELGLLGDDTNEWFRHACRSLEKPRLDDRAMHRVVPR